MQQERPEDLSLTSGRGDVADVSRSFRFSAVDERVKIDGE